MKKQKLFIENIPAILWGEKSPKLFLMVHGNMSHKEDRALSIFAEEAISKGYQVLSFDLPEHGDRKNENYPCMVQNCVKDLNTIMNYVKLFYSNVSLFACSMGAYFSFLSYKNESLEKSLFLSPVLNMERIILNMMTWFEISEEKLREKKEINTPIGQTLYWDYYCYVKENPIEIWDSSTFILYGTKDDLCEFEVISSFTESFNCDLTIMEDGEHYFHTHDQLEFFRRWAQNIL